MQNRRHLVVLAVTAALFGSSACKEGAAPNPLPTIRLTPASVQADSAIDAARLSDRDTATPLLLDGRRVVSFHFDHVVELRKVKVFGSGVRVAVLQPGEKMLGAQPQLAELEMGAQDAWSAASLSPLVSGSDVAVSLSPLRAGARVAEVELWGAGLPTAPRQIQPVAEASADPKAAQYENLRIVRGEPASATLEPANSAGNCLRSRFAAAGSLAAHSARRAYLVYEANVQRPTALKRSLDGEAPVGGFWLASTDEARTLVDEIDPERLRGQDAVALCLPADATGPVSVHGLRLLLQLDDGVDVFDRDSHARFAAALDGDRSTSHSLHGERSEVGFDRPFAIERAALHLGSAPAQLVSLGGFDGRAWNEMGGRSLGEQTTDLALGDRTLQSVALTFAGRARPDVPAATLAELELAGSGVGPRVAVPRIVITSPALRFDGGQTIGERFGDRAYIAGWAESPAGAGSVEIDGAPAGVDGAFGPALRRRAGSSGTWDAVVRARFPDGTELTRAIRFGDDHQDEIDAGSSSAKSDGSEATRYGRRNQSAWNLLDPKKGGKVDLGSEIELDVPEGAVNAKVIAGVTRKGVEATPRLDAGMINVTAPGRAAYRFLPKGQKFLKPVNVTLPYDPALLPDGVGPEQIKTYFFDPKKDRWIALPRAALAPGRVVSQTTHFTFMINAVLVLPDHPGPTSFNPTSIKDLKAADPSAGIDLVEPPQGNNQGTAQLSFPMRLPKARGAYQPSLRLAYDSGGGSGWLGVGWDLKASSVQVDTRFGVPYYDGREHYVLDGAQLVPQDGTSVDQRCVDGSDGRRYVARVERDFQRIVRCGAGPSTYRFEVTDRSGTLFVYGATDATRLSSARPTGEIGEWFIERVVDLNGNLTLFSYDLDVREAPVAFQDAAQGGLVHNEQFRQLYLRSIEYSGSAPRTGASALTAVTAPGPYRVELRSQQVGGSHLARSDTLTSARFGFKVVTRRLLESVRVRVAESGAARGIREYRMDYQRGSFGKSRLAGVGVYGAWEGERGSGPFFYRHAFEYTDAPDQDGAKPFGGDTGPVAWKFDDGADDEPISRSEMSGFGVHGYVGIGLGPTRFNGSAGIRVGFSKHDSNTTSTIADLNGDGLPDRVRLRPSGADVRFNQAFDGSAGHMSRVAPPSDPFAGRPLANVPLPTLGSESGSSRNIAAQATFGPIGVNVGKTFFSSTTPEYMIDADGDGLVDVLTRGTILFNQPRNGALLPDCVASDPSTFCFNPAKWVRSIGAPHPAEGFVGTNPSDAPADDPGGLDPDVNPSDALLEWLAPYNGNVDVSGMLSFVNRPSGASDPRWDGVRLRIYRVTPIQGPTPYRTDLLAEVRKTLTDPPAATPVSLSYVDVTSGSRLYFVLSTLGNFPVDGRTPLEEASFAPRIRYRYACTAMSCGAVSDADVATLDPAAASLYEFDSASDFKLAGAPLGALVVPDKGMLHIRSVLHKKGPTSDDVRICIQRFPSSDSVADVSCNAAGGPAKVFSTTVQGNLVRDIPIAVDVPVEIADRLVFREETDLSIDPGALDWDIGGNLEPSGAIPPGTDPEALAFQAEAYVPLHLAVDPSSAGIKSARPYPAPIVPFVAPEHGVLHVYTVDPPCISNALLAARKLGGPVLKGADAFAADVEMRRGEEIFFEVHGESDLSLQCMDPFSGQPMFDPISGLPLTVVWSVTGEFAGDTGRRYPALPVNYTVDALALGGDPTKLLRIQSPFGGGFHGFRYGIWGGPTTADIDPTLFEASSTTLPWDPNQTNDQQADAAIAAMQDENSPERRRARFVAPLLPRRQGTYFSRQRPGYKPGVPAYVNRDGTTFITASTMHAAHERGPADAAGRASSVAAFFKMGSMARASAGDALSGGLSVGVGPFGAGLSVSSGHSRSRADVRDMNGDGIIDVIRSDSEGSGRVRLTDLHTLAEHTGNVDFGFKPGVRLQESTDLSLTLNMGLSDAIKAGGCAPPQQQPAAFTGAGGSVDGQPGSMPPPTSGGGVGSAGGTSGVVCTVGGMFPSVGGGIGVNLSATKGELIDINGDGLPDAVRREPGSDNFYVRLNLGTRFADEEDVIPAGRWSGGALDGLVGNIASGKARARQAGFAESLRSGALGNAADPNLVRRSTAVTVMENMGFGAGFGAESYSAGVNWESSVSATAVSFVDVNGDGLPDYVRKSSRDGQIYVMLNTGYGFAREVAWNVDAWPTGVAQPWLRKAGPVQRILQAAVGSEPTVDAIEASGSYSQVPTIGFSFTYSIPLTFFFTPWLHIGFGGDVTPKKISGYQLSMMDIDGDGLPDHVLKAEKRDGYENQSIYVRLNKLGGANLLKRVARPLGGSIELEYRRKGNTVDLPGKRLVLARVVTRDGRGGAPGGGVAIGHDFETVFGYEGGYFDRAEREFLGFRKIERTNPDRSLVVQYFRNENFAVKGLLEREETWSADRRLFVRADNEYYATANRLAGPAQECRATTPFFLDANDFCGSFVTMLKKTTKGFYEGTGGPGVLVSLADAPIRTSQTYERYDQYGNVLSFLDSGDERDPNDDHRATVTYAGGDAAFGLYSVSRPESIVVMDLARGFVLRKRAAGYDDRGNLSRLTSTIDQSGDVAVSDLHWDLNGNLQKLEGPTGAQGSRYALSYQYDAATHTYVVRTEDSHAYASSAEYDVRFGETTRTVDINGNETRREFDAFSRLSRFFGPEDPTNPLVTIDYAIGQSVPFARTKNRQAGGRSIDTVVLVDGIKRAIQTKKTAEVSDGGGIATAVGWSVSGQQVFDAMGRVAAQGQKVFESGSSPLFRGSPPSNATLFEYDALGRTTRTVEPDGAITAISHGFGTVPGDVLTRLQATATDALGNVRAMYRDPADRVVAIRENTGTTEPITRYVYNPLSELLSITDAAGNRTHLAYDLLGRRTEIDNPDSGRVEFTFDGAGNLVKKVDANLREKGAAITYQYDFDQLVAIHYPFSREVKYEYGRAGAAENGAGRIVDVVDEAGEESRGYGQLGELVRSTRTVRPLRPGKKPRTFETRFAFDPYGRMMQVVYPDGERLSYQYDAGGLLASAVGLRPASKWRPRQVETYLRALTYDEFGQRRLMLLGNGAVTSYEYEPLTRRLHSLRTQARNRTLQALTYEYDPVGNVTGMVNALGQPVGKRSGSVSYAFGYDRLYRLTHATGTAASRKGVIDQFESSFSYSDIHNMLKNKQVHRLIEIEDDEKEIDYPEKTNHDFAYLYQANGPHQATQVGRTLLGYDRNGNTAFECRREEEEDDREHGDPRFRLASVGKDDRHDEEHSRCEEEDGELRRFVWNEDNQLRAVIDTEGEHLTRFLYDAAGERVVKLGESGPSITVGQFFAVKGRKSATKHIFAGPTRLASKIVWTPEIDEDDREESRRLSSIGVHATALVEGCSGCQLASTHGPAIEHDHDEDEFRPATYYYHPDHLGSTSWVTDEHGKVHEQVEYFPYGEVWRERHDNEEPRLAQRFLFTGKEFDEETGLYYFGARYLDPRFVRWMSPDPLLTLNSGDPAQVSHVPRGPAGALSPLGLSTYSYATWNPVKNVDPNGYWTDPIHHPELRSHVSGVHNPRASSFGSVRTNSDGTPRGHGGLDLRAVVGEGTFAVGDGKVAFAGTTKDFGKLVVYRFTYRYTASNLLSDLLHGKSANEIANKIAKDGKEYYSWHAHLSGIEKGIGAGSPVTEGQLIGHTGKSGNAANIPASERHLHFEMTSKYPPGGTSRELTGRVDPAQFFQDLNVNPKDNRRRTP